MVFLTGPFGRARAVALSSLAAVALAGCDPLVDAGYRGEPLFGFDAQIVSFQGLVSQGYDFRVSLFWVRDLSARLDPSLLSEQASVAVDIDFPASVAVNVFAPPTADQRVTGTTVGVGLVLVYEDRDRNGRFTPGLSPSELVGGAPYEAVVYVPDEAALASAPFDDDLAVGFQTVRLPLGCAPETGLALCDVPLGAACADDAACGPGPGTCLHEIDGASWPDGACAVDILVSSCLAPSDAALTTNADGTEAWWIAGCSGGDCRAGYRCDPDLLGCVPADTARARGASDRPRSAACDTVVGAPCVVDGDCGRDGVCFVRSGGQSFVGGYCAVPVTAGCTPSDARAVPWTSYDESKPTHYMKACGDDAACRVDEGYVCDFGWEVCVPEGPIEVELGEDLLVTPICVGLEPVEER